LVTTTWPTDLYGVGHEDHDPVAGSGQATNGVAAACGVGRQVGQAVGEFDQHVGGGRLVERTQCIREWGRCPPERSGEALGEDPERLPPVTLRAAS
jgi:hypothetical protein